jgi:hypothetical protein
MEKEFIPYEQALALKELGFDEPCLGNYRLPSNRLITEWEIRNTPEHTLGISAPLYQQAFRWFREKYNLISVIGYHNLWEYSFLIETIKEHKTVIIIDKIETYEEAELECLKKLIEIVK